MALPTNAHTRFDLATRGETVREDLSDMIYQITPTKTPLITKIGRTTTDNTKPEWQIHSLAAATANNAHLDGDDFAGDAVTDPPRIRNPRQIPRKDLVATGRANKVNTAGYAQTLAQQVVWAGEEIMRDLESSVMSNNPAVLGDNSTAPKLGGVGAWLKSNSARGATGADPALSDTTHGIPSTGPTTGTDRGLTETLLRNASKQCYDQGGEPDCIFLSPTNKQNLSTYYFTSTSRNATPYQDFGANPRGGITSVGAVDVWISDFQRLEIHPDRFMSDEEVFVLDTDMFELVYLRPFHTEEIAKSGDSEKRMLIADVTLKCKNEAASAVIADVDETAAVAA